VSDWAIRADGLGKRYTIGEHIGYATLRESARAWRARLSRVPRQDLWALRDVSFEIGHGNAVGIIGRNGAGKSTLLKILSQITEPTAGRVEIRGRVNSLLEVGTAFHPELTGRENVYLNGAILGMTRAEIGARFDEIVEFAGVARFIDTPVKRYSSGMQLRLGFAVAAHLEPDVLFIDEVLAVGDAGFQRKCIGRIGEVAREGRTVLFVSHNMAAIRDLCPNSMWIDAGEIRAIGPSGSVVAEYLRASVESDVSDTIAVDDQPDAAFAVRSIRIVDDNGRPQSAFEVSDPPVVEIECVVRDRIPGLYGYVALAQSDGTIVLEGDSNDPEVNPLDELDVGEYVLRVGLPPRTFAPGDYRIEVTFSSRLESRASRIANPGVTLGFTLEDFTTWRGALVRRRGFLVTPLDWRIDPS
jgi:lipopolysaccharide transport system ATP-binding protein